LGAPKETHLDSFIIYAFSEATLTPPDYDAGPDPANPLNPVRQLHDFFESNPSLVDYASLTFTSDATPATAPGLQTRPSPARLLHRETARRVAAKNVDDRSLVP